ncbi:MAG: hypothetical protein K940chlam9_00777 [Chlamydiae bacterium]|nr:hypothetical protein [Chlamydiota bacterium]
MKRILFLFFIFAQFASLDAQEGSVICLHGFFRSYKCMIPMGNAFREEGYHVYLWDYPSRRETIEGHAQDLVKIMQMIAKERPGEPIHFVSHSMGGLIVRAAVSHPHCPPEGKMGKAILLAPPNQGASLARKAKQLRGARFFFGKKAGEQLMNYSPEEMLAIGDFPSSMDVMVIAGTKHGPFLGKFFDEPNDGKVAVSETYLPTPHTHKVLPVAHNWIMTSRKTIQLSKEFLHQDQSQPNPQHGTFERVNTLHHHHMFE